MTFIRLILLDWSPRIISNQNATTEGFLFLQYFPFLVENELLFFYNLTVNKNIRKHPDPDLNLFQCNVKCMIWKTKQTDF